MIRRDSSGVTLVELAVILVILTICAGITMQGAGLLQGALGAARAKGAADVIAQAVRSARQRAITNSQDYCIALRAVGQYQIYTGARSGTTCTGTSVEGPTNLPGGETMGADVALRFTPVSTVDPIGPTDIVVTSTTEGATCSVTLTVTPEGGTQLPGTTC